MAEPAAIMEPTTASQPRPGLFHRLLRRPAPTPDRIVQQFERRSLVRDAGADLSVRERNLSKQEGVRAENVGIPESLRNSYRAFLKNYVSNLSRMAERPDPTNPNRTMYQTILEGRPERAIDRRVLSILTTREVDADGHFLGIKMNEVELNKFLNTSAGMAITTQLIEELIPYMSFAAGIKPLFMLPGRRQTIAEEINAPMNMDRGQLNRLIQDHILPAIDKRIRDVDGRRVPADGHLLAEWRRWHVLLTGFAGGSAGGMSEVVLATALAGGTLAAGPLAVGAAVGGGVALGLIEAIHSLRPGVELQQHLYPFALHLIKADPNEVAYINALTGINANDFMVNAVGQVVRAPGIAESVDLQTKQMNITELEHARVKFYESIGVHKNRLDGFAEQSLFFPIPGFTLEEGALQQEQTDTLWMQDIQDVFRPNNGGVRDVLGRWPNDPSFCRPAAGASIDYYNNVYGLDFQGNMQRFHDARRTVLARWIERYVVRETVGVEKTTDYITAIDAKVKQRGETGELRKRRTEVLIQRKTGLEGDKPKIVEQQIPIESYRGKLTELQKARTRLNVLAATVTDPATRAVYANIDDTLAALENAVAVAGSQVTIGRVTLGGDFAARRAAARTNRANGLRGVTNKLVVDGVNQIYVDEIAEIVAQEKRMTDLIEQINSMRTEIQTIEQDLAPRGETRRKTETVISRTNSDYRLVTGWSINVLGPPPVRHEITPLQLLDPNLTVEQLMERVNAAYTAGRALVPPVDVGWPPERNSRQDVRMIIENAKIEASVIRQIRAINPTFAAILNAGVSEFRMRDLTNVDLLNEVNAQMAAHIPPLLAFPNNAASLATMQSFIDFARNERERITDMRLTAIQERTERIDQEVVDLDERVKAVDFTQEIQRLEAAKDLLLRQETIIRRGNEVASMQGGKYTEVNPATVARGYTAAEVASGFSEGYVNLLDVMFGYQNSPNRDQLFQRFSTIMPPDRLANLLDIYVIRPAVVARGGVPLILPRNNINLVLTDVVTEINNGYVTGQEIGRGLQAIIRNSRIEAMAME